MSAEAGVGGRERRWLPWLAYITCIAIWGTTWMAHKWALEDLTPGGLIGWRFLCAGLLCVMIARWRSEAFVRRAHLPPLILAGLFLSGICNVVTAWTLQWIPSGVGAVLQAPIPVWMALLTWRSEPLKLSAWVGVLLGFAGVALVMWPDQAIAMPVLPAIICVLMAGAWSWASLYQRRHVHSGGLYSNAGVQMLISGCLSVVLTPLFGGYTQHGEVGWQALAATAYLTIGGSCIAFACYLYLTQVWHPARAGSFSYLTPLIAVLIGWAVGGEAITSRLLLGMAVILLAVAVLQWASAARR